MTRFPPEFPVQISEFLRSRSPRKLEAGGRGHAAVLMPLYADGQDCFFLLTLRTEKVETHKGQVSFPGGVMDAQDSSLLETALRETWEEVGLPASQIQILGEFDDYSSVTDLVVTPFVGWLKTPFALSPNQQEVQEILHVPLSVFQEERVLRVEMRQRDGLEYPVYFYSFQGKEIWGLTARIIRDFLQASLLFQPPLH